MTIDQIVTQLKEAKKAYYSGSDPIMTDAEYDALEEELTNLDPENKVLKMVGASGLLETSPFQKVSHNHDFPMGSLKKSKCLEDINSWISKKGNPELVVSAKLDGSSLEMQVENDIVTHAVTRGTGTNGQGEDVLSNVSRMRGFLLVIPGFGSGSIRAEVILTLANFKKHFSDQANSRNSANGELKSKDGEKAEHLDIICYNFESSNHEFTKKWDKFIQMKEWGLQVAPSWLLSPDKRILETIS